MLKFFVSCMLSALAAVPALASDEADIIAVVHQAGDALFKECAGVGSIVDSVPPYEWHGSDACSTWTRDDRAYWQKNGLTDGHVAVGRALHLEMSADHAFVVAPLTFTFMQRGKDGRELAWGTFVLRKSTGGWRITGWTYSPQ